VHLGHAPDATPHGEGHERAPSRALHDLEERAATVRCGVDVEEDDLVRAVHGVAFGERGRVAFVGEVNEAGALDDPAVRDIETGDDAYAEHQ